MMAITHHSRIESTQAEPAAELQSTLERLLARHREEAARLREELGDPEEALSVFVRERYDRASLEAVLRDLLEGGNIGVDANVVHER